MSDPRDIIGIVKDLSERCDSGSHFSEELDNARISPADLADKLLIAVEALENMAKNDKGTTIEDDPGSGNYDDYFNWGSNLSDTGNAQAAKEALQKIRSTSA